jgi:ribonuclease HI
MHTDGAALRNPHGPAGWAWVAVLPDGSRRQGTGSFARASNNQAELTAAIEGLNALPPDVCSSSRTRSTWSRV